MGLWKYDFLTKNTFRLDSVSELFHNKFLISLHLAEMRIFKHFKSVLESACTEGTHQTR